MAGTTPPTPPTRPLPSVPGPPRPTDPPSNSALESTDPLKGRIGRTDPLTSVDHPGRVYLAKSCGACQLQGTLHPVTRWKGYEGGDANPAPFARGPFDCPAGHTVHCRPGCRCNVKLGAARGACGCWRCHPDRELGGLPSQGACPDPAPSGRRRVSHDEISQLRETVSLALSFVFSLWRVAPLEASLR